MWDFLGPDDLSRGYNSWICPHCEYRVNGGYVEGHECDPRSVARVQAGRLVSTDAVAELEGWFNRPARKRST